MKPEEADSLYKPNLPEKKEYLHAIESLIERKPPLEKIKFENLNRVLSLAGMSEDPYRFVGKEKINADEARAVAEKAFLAVNAGKRSEDLEQALRELWDYLAEEDKLEPADLIFVFGGGQNETRANEAVRLYREKFGPKILFTGAHASSLPEGSWSEAEYYRKVAVASGVPERDIIVETKAKNTPENAVNSVKILKESNFTPRKMIIVTAPYHMKRCSLNLRSVADWKPQIIRHDLPDQAHTDASYFTDKDVWSSVFFEYLKLYNARLMEHF